MNCPSCAYLNKRQTSYCGNCGHKIIEIKNNSNYRAPLKNVSLLYFVILLYLVILNFSAVGKTYTSLLVADGIFAVIVLVFFFLKYRVNKVLLRPGKLKINVLVKIMIIAPLLALCVYHLADFINQTVFNTQNGIYYNAYLDSPAPFFFSILSIAVFPAVFEEIAFRGVLFNETLKITRLKSTILITSILFTLLHFSLIASLWLFPGGLLFGYLRAKHKTLLYGMFAHFMYNASVVIFQIILQ